MPSFRSIFRCAVCSELKYPSHKIPRAAIACRGHNVLCRNCATQWINTSVEQGEALVMCPCLADGRICNQAFCAMACRELVTTEVFNKWCHLLCESALRGYERCYCPNKDCRELIVDECIGPSGPRKIMCPRCRKSCCFKCSRPWEDGQTDHRCDEVHVFVETKNWKRCPGCKNYVEHDSGCRYITCRCQTEFCYLCGRKSTCHSCPCSGRGPMWACRFLLIVCAITIFTVVISIS